MRLKTKAITLVATLTVLLTTATAISVNAFMQCSGTFSKGYDYGTVLPYDDAWAYTKFETEGHIVGSDYGQGHPEYFNSGYVAVEVYYMVGSEIKQQTRIDAASTTPTGGRIYDTEHFEIPGVDTFIKTHHLGDIDCTYAVAQTVPGVYGNSDLGFCPKRFTYDVTDYH